MLDYFCYVIKKYSLRDNIFSKEDKFENFSYVYRNEIMAARDADKFLVYDEPKDKFFDGQGNQVTDLNGMSVFPRCQVGWVEKLDKRIRTCIQ